MELEYSADQCHSCYVARCRGARTTSLKCPNTQAGLAFRDDIMLQRACLCDTEMRLQRRKMPSARPVIWRVPLSRSRGKFIVSNFNEVDGTTHNDMQKWRNILCIYIYSIEHRNDKKRWRKSSRKVNYFSKKKIELRTRAFICTLEQTSYMLDLFLECLS